MDCDLLILGGGPAGLTAAIYAGRADRKTIVLERALVGGQVAQTQDIANFPGFPEGVDGPGLAARMQAQAERFGVEFRECEALALDRDEAGFRIECRSGAILARTVILATGSDPRPLGVPGETELRGRGVSYCGTCDGPFFRGKRVVVVGGGDAALKEGLHVAKFASRLTIVHRRDAFRGERIYQRQIATHDRIEVRWNAIVERIEGTAKVEAVALADVKTGARTRLETDGVFIFVGTQPNTSLLARLLPEAVGRLVETGPDMMTAVPGLFAIGDVRAGSFRQVATAVGEGATAAMAAEHWLEQAGG